MVAQTLDIDYYFAHPYISWKEVLSIAGISTESKLFVEFRSVLLRGRLQFNFILFEQFSESLFFIL